MAAQIPKDFRRVIVAASVGNVIEWYDFYIFGSLAAVLSVKFFEKSHPVAALLSTIALFTAGFLVRPLGAFLFGWLGDRVGRKYTFLITLSGMGLGTGAIGLIPTFESIGLSAAFILFGLRMIQGLCLGGEYGGAITYVAEHVSDERRGYYTGWLQTSPTLGIVVSLAVIIATRTYFGNQVFDAWAWRIPFLVSFLLVAIAIYIRLQLQETPIFQEIKAKGQMTRNPWKEAFLSANIKFVLIASIVVIGEGVVWYSGQFWALYFLQQVSKVDPLNTAYVVGAGLLLGTPTLILFGWLSDLIGRKPVILAGFLLAALTYYPLYTWLGTVTQPGNINYPVAIIIIAILVSYVGMVYGPIGAFLAEYFPGRIRYTSVSVPYHIGNGWGGGLVPLITTAAFQST
ncbi:MAG: MHS family MFS transporter, partial [Betaproteobacteria bacterium]